MKIEIENEAAMLELGAYLAALLPAHGSVHITGSLGAGKTTLCRGILRALGHKGAVKSPTFTLVEPYKINSQEIFHFDLYRLNDPDELEYIGLDDYFGHKKLCLIEWPEKAEGSLPAHDVEISIDVSGEKRNIGIYASSQSGETVCKELKNHYVQGGEAPK